MKYFNYENIVGQNTLYLPAYLKKLSDFINSADNLAHNFGLASLTTWFKAAMGFFVFLNSITLLSQPFIHIMKDICSIAVKDTKTKSIFNNNIVAYFLTKGSLVSRALSTILSLMSFFISMRSQTSKSFSSLIFKFGMVALIIPALKLCSHNILSYFSSKVPISFIDTYPKTCAGVTYTLVMGLVVFSIWEISSIIGGKKNKPTFLEVIYGAILLFSSMRVLVHLINVCLYSAKKRSVFSEIQANIITSLKEKLLKLQGIQKKSKLF